MARDLGADRLLERLQARRRGRVLRQLERDTRPEGALVAGRRLDVLARRLDRVDDGRVLPGDEHGVGVGRRAPELAGAAWCYGCERALRAEEEEEKARHLACERGGGLALHVERLD